MAIKNGIRNTLVSLVGGFGILAVSQEKHLDADMIKFLDRFKSNSYACKVYHEGNAPLTKKEGFKGPTYAFMWDVGNDGKVDFYAIQPVRKNLNGRYSTLDEKGNQMNPIRVFLGEDATRFASKAVASTEMEQSSEGDYNFEGSETNFSFSVQNDGGADFKAESLDKNERKIVDSEFYKIRANVERKFDNKNLLAGEVNFKVYYDEEGPNFSIESATANGKNVMGCIKALENFVMPRGEIAETIDCFDESSDDAEKVFDIRQDLETLKVNLGE